MRTIVAGPRDLFDLAAVESAIRESGIKITELVSGNATGVDADGELYAERNGIPVKLFRADWDSYGRFAGPIRNRKMAGYAQALIAIWDGKSRGTKNMIEEAQKKGLKVYVHWIARDNPNA